MRPAVRCALGPCLVAVSALVAPVAAADDDFLFSPASVESCLAAGGGGDCIGLAATACMEATPWGASTIGMTTCMGAEHDWWDGRLNVTYQALMEKERRTDSDFPPSPGGLGLAETLRAQQRAWIAYRDARCTYEMAQWMGGTGGRLVHASCLLQMTAEQTLWLDARLMAED